MKLFSFRTRPAQNPTQVPHARVEAAHVVGPAKIRAQAEHLMIECESRQQMRLDVEGLTDVLAYGEVTVTTAAMQLMKQHEIGMSWLSGDGRQLLGRMTHDSSRHALTRLLQYKAWEDRLWQLSMARELVQWKIEGAQAAMRHYQRQGKRLAGNAAAQLDQLLEACRTAPTVDAVRGIEGNAAAIWYGQYATYFGNRWPFKSRNRRPPKDPVNALLSLGYMQVYRRIAARIEAGGFEASLGALHEFRPGRLSMACDVMEPLRIPAVDRFVLAICRQGILSPDDFVHGGATEGVSLKPEKLTVFLRRFEEHWHQGFFGQLAEGKLNRWRESIRERVSDETSRASAYLKKRALRQLPGSGKTEDDDF